MLSYFRAIAQYFFKLVLPISLCLTFIVSIGPAVQSYGFSLLNSDAPSIYGSAYHDTLIEFPALSTWIGVAFDWQYALMAVAIAICIFHSKTPRLLMWRSALATFFIITASDIFQAVWKGTLSGKLITESTVANLLGGIILGAILIVIYSLADFLYRHVPSGIIGKAVCSVLVVIIGGLFVSSLTYYIADLFYNPLPVKFEGSFSSPSSGWYGLENPAVVSDKKSARPFSLIPANELSGEMSWVSASPMNINISDAQNDEQYKVSIQNLTANCGPEEIKKHSLAKPFRIADGIAKARISFDAGSGGFSTVSDSVKTQQFRFVAGTGPDKTATIVFNLTQDPKTKNLQATQAVDKKTSVFVSSSSSTQKFLIISDLHSESNKTPLSARTLTLKLNDHFYQFIYRPNSFDKAKGNEGCASVSDHNVTPPKTVGSTTTQVIDVKDEAVALLTIEKTYADSHLGERQLKYEVSDASGWITWGDLSSEQLQNQPLGVLSFIAMHGNLADITADGGPVAAKSTSSVSVSGKLNAAFDTEGRIHVIGQAKGLWKNDVRLNLTKWEKLGWEPKIFILTFAGSFLLLLWPLLGRRLRSDDRFDWMV